MLHDTLYRGFLAINCISLKHVLTCHSPIGQHFGINSMLIVLVFQGKPLCFMKALKD